MRKNTSLHVALGILVLGIFAFNVHRYWFLGDDCFIAFRFSQNLVEGHGPVFNPGEFVEGYTQPLWILVVALGMQLGIEPEVFAPAVGAFFGLVILLLLLDFTRRRTQSAGLWMWLAPLCLASNRTFTAWCTGGLGSQIFAALVVWACVRFVLEWERGKVRPLGSGLLFALATFARPEGGLFFAVAGAFLAANVLLRRKMSFSSLLLWPFPVILIVGAHFLWRHGYYGDWLPNTFYAKVSGFWWEQASLYLSLFVRDHALFLAAPLLLVLVRRGAPMAHGFFASQILLYVVYIAYIGGDRFEYRFMTPVLPLLYWLLSESVRELVQRLGTTSSTRHIAVGVGMLGILLVLFTAALPSVVTPPMKRHDIVSIEAIGQYAAGRASQGKFLRELVDEGYLTGNELIAVRGAGALPYYSRFPILDLHGLNDVEIAHSDIAERGVVSHEKMATREYVEERGVVLCNVLNTLVFEERPTILEYPNVELPPYFPGEVRVVFARDRYIVFGTTLSDAEFRSVFSRFRILR